MIKKIKANALLILLGGMLVLGIAVMFMENDRGSSSTAKIVDVKVPTLTAVGLEGEELFNATCAACHGKNAAGTDKGPSFIDTTYNPGHHADEAFLRAVQSGVPAHHWKFGNMPPQKVSKDEVFKIVRYVRELQQANGIVYKQHNM